MALARLIDGQIEWYVKPIDVLCEDPTLRGFKEVKYSIGDGGTYETNTNIMIETAPFVEPLEEEEEK